MNGARKIVITGAAGFIGSQLGWQLHRLGHDIHLVDNLSFGYRENLLVDARRLEPSTTRTSATRIS
ncbi:MAG: NAD-dependent epimerase/dehydratase family protein [Methylacidiphilales bacterium]|nr:NAD-dependent epimerase/dehydratase family protein [Candidatus Methylacidiphilales bacterium]